MTDSVTRQTKVPQTTSESDPHSAGPSSEGQNAHSSANVASTGAPSTHDQAHSSTRLHVPLPSDDELTVISKRPPLAEPFAGHSLSPSDMGRALVGQRLGHFELQEFVGGGGMGAVFRATDTMLNRTVAVKVLSGQNTQDDTLARFKKEAQNAARLDHERIARVYYVGEDQGWNYIVFEYIDGVNIRDLVQESGPLPISDAVYFTLQVAEALRHACRRDVVHRDIKPSNILVTNDGRAKLVDMGLARRHEVESQQGDLTASGVTLGTFDYISPEQARDPRNADVRSDIYSLGCTLYYMLTARPPFPDGTVLQKLFSHATDAPPDPRLYRPDIPDDVCRAVQKMLAKSPAQRYQTPDDLIADLLKIGERLGLDSSNGEAAVWVSRPVNRAKWYEQHLPWAAPVVTLIAVILLLDWFSSRGESNALPPPPTLLPPLMNTGADGERPFPTQAQDSPLTSGSDASRGWPEPSRATDSPVELVERERPLLPTNSANGNASTPDAGEVPAVTTPLPPVAPPSAVAGSPATPAGNSTATPGTTSTPPAVPNESAPLRTLLVGPLNTPHGPGAKVVASLGEAVREAANLRELEVIELHFDGEQVELPMDFAVENLTVRAAAGFNPVVVFRPPSVSTLATDRRMVRMFGNRITFERIQFRLELPPEHIGNGWSLFALEQINRLEFEECGLTIRNVGQYGLPAQDEVAFIEFLAPPVLATDSDEEVRSVKVPPLVKLFATIARGEATLIRARTGLPFTISWEQGLLATTERLADIGGALGDQTSDRWVRINLNHVTAAMQDGLCILRSREGAAEHLTPEITAQDCIFLTDSTAPLIEYHTRESLEQLKLKHPTLNGRGNIYSGPSEYWRIITQRGSNFSAPDVSFPLDAGENVGFNEMRLYRKVLWKGLPSSTRPVSSHRKFDYLLSDDPQNPALRGGIDAAGFDALELPEFLPESEPTIPPMRTPDAATPDGEVNPSPAAPAASTMPMMSDKLKMMMTPTTGASGGNGSPASGTKPTDAASPEAP